MKLPDITVSPTKLFNLQYGTIRSWLLISAVEFKVFNHTVEKKTVQEIASAIKTHESNTELFLNALCALELLRKESGLYLNTELSNTFLVEGRETYLGGTLLLNEQWNLESRAQMVELVTNGPLPQQEESDYTGDYFADHIKVMRNLARSGVSQLVAKEINSLPEFSGMNTMLELGGGHGMDCIALAMKSPTLTAVVFDNPAVVKVTQEIIAEYDMEERITTMGGDYMTDPIGGGYDLIYAKATLNFFRDNLNPLFEKIYNALNPGGIFISIHDGLTDEGTKPADIVFSWLSTGLSASDLSFARQVIPNAMLAAGFKSVQTAPFPFFMGDTLEFTLGRK